MQTGQRETDGRWVGRTVGRTVDCFSCPELGGWREGRKEAERGHGREKGEERRTGGRDEERTTEDEEGAKEILQTQRRQERGRRGAVQQDSASKEPVYLAGGGRAAAVFLIFLLASCSSFYLLFLRRPSVVRFPPLFAPLPVPQKTNPEERILDPEIATSAPSLLIDEAPEARWWGSGPYPLFFLSFLARPSGQFRS